MKTLGTQHNILWFLDGTARIRVSEDGVSVVEVTMPRGAMPPLHAQDEDETVHVLDGSVTFYIGDETIDAEAGRTVVAPKGVPHTYRVASKTARWLVVTEPGRFESFVRAVSRPAALRGLPEPAAGVTIEEAVAFTAAAAANGVEILAPAGTLPEQPREAATPRWEIRSRARSAFLPRPALAY